MKRPVVVVGLPAGAHHGPTERLRVLLEDLGYAVVVIMSEQQRSVSVHVVSEAGSR